MLLFSLAGIPPFVGFVGKLFVLQAAVDVGMAWLATAGVIASVIGAFYYLRIIYYIWFGDDVEGIDGRMPTLHYITLMGSAAIMLFGIINLFGLEGYAALAAASLLQ